MKKWMTGIIALTILVLVLPGAVVAQEPEGCADTYIVQQGDTLARIAAQYYNNPWAYPALVFATNQSVSEGKGFQAIADPNLIEPGWKLCIPDTETAMGEVDVDTFKNITYMSDWTKEGTAPLVDGVYSESAAPGSATKTIVKLHDRMAFGYLADGQPLAVAVLVTDPGGSGTFYELAALTFEDGEPQHVALASLGDRVRLQSLALVDGEIVVEMVSHGADDPMCCPTQQSVMRYALQGEELVLLSTNAVGETSDLVGVVWEWERFVGGADADVIEVDDPSKYTLTLNADGTYQVRADCNRATGGYTLDEAHLTLQPGPTTLAECEPGSLYDEFLGKLGYVRTYVSDDEGRLVLNLWADAGNLFFRPAQAVHLEDTLWKLVSYLDNEKMRMSVLSDTEVTAAFAGGKLTGSAGCNSYSASYEYTGNALTLGPAAMTRKMCAEPKGIMEQETAYLAALDSVAGYRVQKGRLELLGAKGDPVATFAAVQETAVPEVVGVTWQWQGTQTPVEKVAVDDPERYTLALLPDGQVDVQADCNRLRGTYALTDTHITVTLTTSTRAACPPDSLADRFIEELNAAVIYFIEGEELFIDLPYDSGTMRFARCVDKTFAFTYDLERDAEGWVAGFADLPADYENDLYELDSGHRELASGLEGSGIYIQGHNRSDDLFMFLKKRVDGLKPETTYQATFGIDLATNVPEGMVGIGGSPGESVYVKAGATAAEPLVAEDASGYLRMSIDKGNQAQEGQDMINLGHVAHPELATSAEGEYKIKSLDNEGRDFRATTDANGGLWFIVGTDSGFEGLTALYYSRISIVLEEPSER